VTIVRIPFSTGRLFGGNRLVFPLNDWNWVELRNLKAQMINGHFNQRIRNLHNCVCTNLQTIVRLPPRRRRRMLPLCRWGSAQSVGSQTPCRTDVSYVAAAAAVFHFVFFPDYSAFRWTGLITVDHRRSEWTNKQADFCWFSNGLKLRNKFDAIGPCWTACCQIRTTSRAILSRNFTWQQLIDGLKFECNSV